MNIRLVCILLVILMVYFAVSTASTAVGEIAYSESSMLKRITSVGDEVYIVTNTQGFATVLYNRAVIYRLDECKHEIVWKFYGVITCIDKHNDALFIKTKKRASMFMLKSDYNKGPSYIVDTKNNRNIAVLENGSMLYETVSDTLIGISRVGGKSTFFLVDASMNTAKIMTNITDYCIFDTFVYCLSDDGTWYVFVPSTKQMIECRLKKTEWLMPSNAILVDDSILYAYRKKILLHNYTNGEETSIFTSDSDISNFFIEGENMYVISNSVITVIEYSTGKKIDSIACDIGFNECGITSEYIYAYSYYKGDVEIINRTTKEHIVYNIYANG